MNARYFDVLLAWRCQDLVEQYRDSISLRNSEVARLKMEGSYKQTTTVLQLAEHQGRESRVLKTLTFLALIYVPASSLPTCY
ncbi:hypothetical protein VDGD_01617 [Verticillium dahliae]|nr:hypothetical protein VDGD_01617 [Verticillium dahliae]